jgi:hypothetical protein
MDGNTETVSKYAIGNCSIKSRVHIPVLWIPAIPAGMTVYRRHLCITMSAERGNDEGMLCLAGLFSIPILAFRLTYPLHQPSIIFHINTNRAIVGTVQPYRINLSIAR